MRSAVPFAFVSLAAVVSCAGDDLLPVAGGPAGTSGAAGIGGASAGTRDAGSGQHHPFCERDY